MRITEQQVFSLLVRNLQRGRARALTAQEQITSGKRVVKPSDDPAAFARIVSGKASLSAIDQWGRNVHSGVTRLDLADRSLGSATSALIRLKELAIQFRSDTNGASERAIGAREVRQWLLQLQQVANTELNGQPIFGGTSTHGRATGLTVSEPITLISGTNDGLVVTVDGVTSGPIALATGTESFSGAELAARLDSRINADAALAAAGKRVRVTFDAGRLVISSGAYGSGSSVVVGGGSSVEVLGFNGGSTTTGDSAFALSATTSAADTNTGGGVISQGRIRDGNAVTLGNYVLRFSAPATFDVWNVSAPVSVTAHPANGGRVNVEAGVADASRVTLDAYEILFTSDTEYQVSNTTTGAVLSSGNPYLSGTPITVDGLRVSLRESAEGAPQAGDRFAIVLDAIPVLTGHPYASGGAVGFDGLEFSIRTGASAPATGDRFRILTGVQYQGDSGLQSIEVGRGQTVATNLPGDAVFTGPATDLFATAKRLVDALQGNDAQGIEQAIADLDTALNQVSRARGQVGALASRLEAVSGDLQDTHGFMSRALSHDQDTDLVKAISQLTLQQHALQAATLAISRIFDDSLLRFLK